MKYFVIASLFLFSVQGLAKGPFGDVTNKSFKMGSDQSKCTAGRLLENAIEDTGIDIVDGNVKQVWECKNGEGPATAKARRCPYDQYMKAPQYKCYSNVSSGYPYVCVSGSRSEMVEEIYAGDKKPRSVPRVRFSQLFVNQGDQKQRNIEMNQQGCDADRVLDWDSTGQFNNGSTDSDPEKCVKILKDAINGGYIYPPQKAEFRAAARPGVKYCDSSKTSKDDDYVSSYLTATKNLFHCYEAFPNLPQLLEASEKISPAPGADAQKKKTVQ